MKSLLPALASRPSNSHSGGNNLTSLAYILPEMSLHIATLLCINPFMCYLLNLSHNRWDFSSLFYTLFSLFPFLQFIVQVLIKSKFRLLEPYQYCHCWAKYFAIIMFPFIDCISFYLEWAITSFFSLDFLEA